MPEETSASAAARILGTAFAALSILAFASIAASRLLSGTESAFSAPGYLLVSAFSWACLFVPLWLAAASILSFLPGWKPAAVATLASSVLPFLPVAALAKISSEPEPFLSAYPAMAAAGLPAIYAGAAVLFVLALALVIAFAKAASRGLFRDSRASSARTRASSRSDRPAFTLGLLAPPDVGPASVRPSSKALPAPVGMASAAADSGAKDEALFVFKLPELPPLPVLHSLEDLPELPGAGEGAGSVDEDVEDEGVDDAEDEELDEGIRDGLAEPGMAEEGRIAAAIPLSTNASIKEAPIGAVGAAAPSVAPSVVPPAGPSAVAAAAASPMPSGEITITTVPPERLRSEAQSQSEAAAAALKRVLALRKDKPYAVPSEGILTAYPDGEYWIVDDKTRHSAEVLRETLAEFKIEAEVTGIRKGPVITMFEILPAPGVKLSKITNLADNIALRLAASSVRIVAPIPGKGAVGIEVPNASRSIVSLRELVEAEVFKTAKMEIPVVLGKDIAGEAKFIDLAQTPHLLIAGATGSGKSVCVNAMILSILFRRSPNEVKLLLIDPKIVELKLYNDIPHLLTPVITEPKRAFQALQYCICEMERRYSLLDHAAVRDIKSYNRKIRDKGYAAERLPYIVVVIDEFADLMATTGKELESTLARLAAMSRAVGIHLVLATQRPSIDVITGLIKANIPSRIAFMVASKFDSRIIIDAVGAEKLLGKGDMLVSTVSDPFPIRMQGAYVSEEEVEKAVEFVKTLGEPEYIDDEIFIDDEDDEEGPSLFGDEDDDPLYEQALEIVLQQGKASASYIQRRLKIGYNRASRLVEMMEDKGIVGPAKGSKPRDIVRNPDVLGGKPTTPPANRGDLSRQPSLMPDLETTPGQRVTGRDEVESDEVASDEVDSSD